MDWDSDESPHGRGTCDDNVLTNVGARVATLHDWYVGWINGASGLALSNRVACGPEQNGAVYLVARPPGTVLVVD